ncbi:hypothetical protein QC763_0009160 [Podospora pseudopauciseta]|uniref:Uncharacterized protein n=2 Tax=Podospora TaxID=5144 RepID=A0ABR0HYH6_9PEZI|nr:hypothetical protein QC763_0009160 [Podospora pseudopauciseta]KAK4681460.1 hypothetical protein QC764_0009230 [Podospora pseudoanserina]
MLLPILPAVSCSGGREKVDPSLDTYMRRWTGPDLGIPCTHFGAVLGQETLNPQTRDKRPPSPVRVSAREPTHSGRTV